MLPMYNIIGHMNLSKHLAEKYIYPHLSTNPNQPYTMNGGLSHVIYMYSENLDSLGFLNKN